MRNSTILAVLGLISMASTSFGATWFLQGTGNFDNPTTWRQGSNAGANGVPGVGDTLQFYGGDVPNPMWDADYTLTLNTNQTVASWDQGYWHTTVRLNLNGHNFTNTGASLYVLAQGTEPTWSAANYVSGGGTLTINGYSAGGTAASGFFLSGTGTKMVFNGDNGNLLGGSPGNEARFVVTGGATVTGTTTWASTRVGGYYLLGVPVSGIVYLSDPGTRMDLNGGPMVVGDQGRGQLIVTNGAAFTNTGPVNLGGWQYGGLAYDGTNGHGTVRVDTNSTCKAGRFDVGMYSTGVVEVVHGGKLLGTDMVLGTGYSTAIPANGTNLAAYGTLTVANVNSRVDVTNLKVGDAGRGEVTVSDNAVLAATGLISLKNSKLTVSDAGVTATGNLTTSGSTNTFRIELGARSHGLAYLQVAGLNLAAGTALDLAVLGNFSAAVNDQIKLIGYGSKTGTFSNYADLSIFTNGAYGFQINYGASSITLTVTAVPAPPAPPPTLNGQWGGSNLTFSWSEAGFKLQWRTNLSTGNWFDYPGTSPVTVPVTLANPTAFFRLKTGLTASDMFKDYVPTVYLFGSGMRSNVTKSASGSSLIITATVTNQPGVGYGHFGGFILPELTLGTNAFGYDFSGSGVLVPLSTAHTNKQLFTRYPWNYSPLLVVKNGDGFISFSFHYPVLSYKHDIEFAMKYAGNGKWQPTHLATFFDYPTTPPGDYHSISALLAPGTSRLYQLVITTGATLAEVVAPYKAYFDSLYPGGKQYTPDLKPFLGWALASQDTPGYPATNPHGWYPNFTNADTLGFEAVVKPEALKHIRGAPGDYNLGNDNFLIWTPTGIVDGDMEYPFMFTTRWSTFTGGTTGTVAALKSLVTPGKRMGFWWGHSQEYQPNWNSTNGRAVFDYTNPVHRAAGHAEMANAIAAGATFIGLDASAHGMGRNPATGATDGRNQVWYFLPWIQELKATYPGVKFISEGMASDVYHRETPSYLEYWGWGGNKQIHGRHLLADILLPGSETIAAIGYNQGQIAEPDLWHGQPYWAPINEEVRLDTVRTAIGYGFVPCVFYSGMSLDHDL